MLITCLARAQAFGLLCRWRSRVGFVVWPRKSRWAVFVRQGAAAAFTQLRLMITALENASATTTKPSLPMGNSMPPQTVEEDDTASDRLEIALLISAMYQEFKSSWRVFDEHKVPGFDSFGEMAIAFGLPDVYPGILMQKLKVRYNLSSLQLCDLPSVTSK